MSAELQSARVRVLTPWTTVRGSSSVSSVVQDADNWLDVSQFGDGTLYLDVADLSNPGGGVVLLYLETSATADESGFLPVVGPIPLAVPLLANATSLVLKTASAGASPLGRVLRWRLFATVGASWSATIRILFVGNRTTYFAPTQLDNCVFWVRADRGLAFSNASVNGWNDQSTSNDPNKNLTGGTVKPALTLLDPNYGNQQTLSFASNAFMTSAAFANPLVQNDTWVIVGNPGGTGAVQVAFESNDMVSGQNVSQNAANQISIATTSTLASTTQWTSPGVVLTEFAGASSNIFFNNFTTPVKSGTVNSGANTSQNSLTVGSADLAFNGPNGARWWGGTIAEIIGFSGVLSNTQKQMLKRYLNNRYALAIV